MTEGVCPVLKPPHHQPRGGFVGAQLFVQIRRIDDGEFVAFPEALAAVDGDEAHGGEAMGAGMLGQRFGDEARGADAAGDGQQGEIVDVVGSCSLRQAAEQRVLNRDWRGIDKSTNVLSFPQIEPFGPVSGILGDIILARETLVREAQEQGVSLEDHFTHLVVHGFLHLLGYDHMDDDEALAMEGLETQILASLGVADPYAED